MGPIQKIKNLVKFVKSWGLRWKRVGKNFFFQQNSMSQES